jgi:hypothetical protein
MEEESTTRIEDWQALVNKPVYASDGKEIGVVSEIQPLHLIVTFGVMTPDKFNIPKTSIKKMDEGTIYLKEDFRFVKDNYAFE